MYNWMPLLAAGNEQGKGPALLFFFGLGVVFLLMGIYSMVTKTVLLRARDRWFFEMLGWRKFSDGFAMFTGACYALGGIMFMVVASAVSMGFNLEDQLKNGPVAQQAQGQPQPQQPIALEPKKDAKPESPSFAPPRQPGENETPQEKADREANERQRQAAQEDAMRQANQQMQNQFAPPMQGEEPQQAADMERQRRALEAEENRVAQLEAARQTALTLPKPSQPLPLFTYERRTLQESPLLGEAKDARFIDHAPEGGVLVGAIFFIGKHFGPSVAGIQPIYQVGDKYVKGALCGTETDYPVQEIAEPGNVVAGLKARVGLIMDSAQFAYGPLKGTKIDPKKGYFGAQMGKDGGSSYDFYAEGRSIGGIFGTFEPDKALTSLGMYVIPRMQASAMPSSTENELRTFTSADGKFSVDAKFVQLNDDGTVSLEKEDGSRIKAPLTGLSDADKAYVDSKR